MSDLRSGDNPSNRAGSEPSPASGPGQAHGQDHGIPESELPQPVLTKTRWPFLLMWLVPIAAVVAAGFYYRMSSLARGKEIVVTFADASGLRPGETLVSHLGVRLGTVRRLTLSDSGDAVKVSIELRSDADAFARTGTQFWIVRPRISLENVSGLGTIASGPYVEALPGPANATLSETFDGLKAPAEDRIDGLHFTLVTERLDHLQAGASVSFRGFEVGTVRSVALRPDSRGVEVGIVIQKPFERLVRDNSRFWIVKAADVKGGLFSGVEFKLESIRTLLSGGVAFASPTDLGPAARDGTQFKLHDELDEDWLKWSPTIGVDPALQVKQTAAGGTEAPNTLGKTFP